MLQIPKKAAISPVSESTFHHHLAGWQGENGRNERYFKAITSLLTHSPKTLCLNHSVCGNVTTSLLKWSCPYVISEVSFDGNSLTGCHPWAGNPTVHPGYKLVCGFRLECCTHRPHVNTCLTLVLVLWHDILYSWTQIMLHMIYTSL